MRQRAAALITQGDRVLSHQLEGDRFWALPGGGIEPGESAADALAREPLAALQILAIHPVSLRFAPCQSQKIHPFYLCHQA